MTLCSKTCQNGGQPLCLRFKIGYFGMGVGMAAQALMWNVMSKHGNMTSLYNIPIGVSTFFWWSALVILVSSGVIYLAKLIQWPRAVQREMLSPVRANFFFMPTLTVTFLLLSVPDPVSNETAVEVTFYIVLTIELLMKLALWSEWLVSRELGLSTIYTPAMLSVVNCFVLAKVAVKLDEGQLAQALVAVGLMFYLIVLVRTFGRPIDSYIPIALLPSLFFYLAPVFAVAAVWTDLPIAQNQGRDDIFDFSMASLFFYFGLFMYALILRYSVTFLHIPFGLTCWAYTFPTSAAGLAAIEWSRGLKSRSIFALFLCGVSTLLVLLIVVIMVVKIVTESIESLLPYDDLVAFADECSIRPPEKETPKRSKCKSKTWYGIELSIADMLIKRARWNQGTTPLAEQEIQRQRALEHGYNTDEDKTENQISQV